MLKSSKLILLCILVLSGIISSFYPIHAFLDFSDSDQDGLSDELEISWGSDPFFNDTDNDGYFDFDEYEIGSNPTDWNDPEIIDHDFDGIADGKEFLIYKTNWTNPDTDGDGYDDLWEIMHQTNPLNQNDPTAQCTESNNAESFIKINEEKIQVIDTDADLLSDEDEMNIYHTNPLCNDTDGDLLMDYQEVMEFMTDPCQFDSLDGELKEYFIYYDDNYIFIPAIGKILASYTALHGNLVLISEKYASILAKSHKIESISLNTPILCCERLQDSLNWGFDRIEGDKLWGGLENSVDIQCSLPLGTSIKVTVIDDVGFQTSHRDIVSAYRGGHDYIDNDDDPYGEPDPYIGGHGTQVAGVIVAADNDYIGSPTGIAPKIDLYCRRISFTTSHIVAAIDDSIADGTRIICCSWGQPMPFPDSVYQAILRAINANVIVVAAAGNGGPDNIGEYGKIYYPAAYPEVIAVGSISDENQRSSFSDFGPTLDFVAPGEDILLCEDYEASLFGYTTMSGTSYAAPMVVGVIANILSVNPTISPSQVLQILQQTSEKLSGYTYDQNGWNEETGYGLVKAAAAVRKVVDSLSDGITSQNAWSLAQIQHATVFHGSSGTEDVLINLMVDYAAIDNNIIKSYLKTKCQYKLIQVHKKTYRMTTTYYWQGLPYQLLTWSGDYTYNPSYSSPYRYQVDPNYYYLHFGCESQSTTKSYQSEWNYNDGWNNLGYFYTSIYLLGTQEYNVHLRLKLSNNLASIYKNGYEYEDDYYYYKKYILQFQYRILIDYYHKPYGYPSYVITDTHDIIVGDGNGFDDTSIIPLLPGDSPA